MRTIKRLLLTAKELAVFLLGLILSVLLAVTVSQWNYGEVDLPSFVLFLGVLFTCFGVFWVRRKDAPRKFAYDVAGWALDSAERKLHPQRRKYKRILIGVLVALPSALALLVLFFFPLATHLRHPGSQYFRHYRIPIPWSVAVFFPAELDGGDTSRFLTALVPSKPWPRFGMTTFWDQESLSAMVTLGIRRRSEGDSDVPESVRLGDTTDLLRRDFNSNSPELTCWQWRCSSPVLRRQSQNELVWSVVCRSSTDAYQQRFEALFYGRQESMPDFYRIVEGVSFVK